MNLSVIGYSSILGVLFAVFVGVSDTVASGLKNIKNFPALLASEGVIEGGLKRNPTFFPLLA